MKFRSFALALAAVVTVLLLVGTGGLFWLVSQSPLSLLRGNAVSSPAAAMFVPKQAPLMASLLVNPDRLEQFRLAIAPSGQRRAARSELERFRQTLLGDRGLSYEEDIQPWLGDEITWAVTTPDLDRDAENGLQPGYLLAVATRDPQQAREFLQVFWQKRAIAGTDLVFEQYSGIKIISGQQTQQASSSSTEKQLAASTNKAKKAAKVQTVEPVSMALASAVVGDRFVLFGNSPKVLRQAINTVQAGEFSLSNSAAYQEAVSTLPSQRMGLTFINLTQLGRWLGQEELATANDQQEFESLVAGMALDRQGLLAETVLLPRPGASLKTSRPRLEAPVDALQYLPAEVPFVASGKDLRQMWAELSSSLAGYGTLSALVNQPIEVLEQRLGADFSKDLVNWVEREFALALVPNPLTQQPDWVFVAEKTPATAPALDNLDAIARKRGLSIGPVALDGQEAFAWTKLATRETRRKAKTKKTNTATTLQATVEGVHTSVGKYEIFATSVEVMDRALKAAQNGLIKSSDFQAAVAPLDSQNDGYLYVDWNSVKGVLEERVPLLKLVELTAKPLLNHVRSLTITSYGSEVNLKRGAVFIRLKA